MADPHVFQRVTVWAADEVKRHQVAVERARAFGSTPPAPSLAVRLHGKTVEKLGEWHDEHYRYAAIREIGAVSTNYELIDPDYLKCS